MEVYQSRSTISCGHQEAISGIAGRNRRWPNMIDQPCAGRRGKEKKNKTNLVVRTCSRLFAFFTISKNIYMHMEKKPLLLVTSERNFGYFYKAMKLNLEVVSFFTIEIGCSAHTKSIAIIIEMSLSEKSTSSFYGLHFLIEELKQFVTILFSNTRSASLDYIFHRWLTHRMRLYKWPFWGGAHSDVGFNLLF